MFVLSKIQLYNRKGWGFCSIILYVLTEINSESGQEEVNIHRSCTFYLSLMDSLKNLQNEFINTTPHSTCKSCFVVLFCFKYKKDCFQRKLHKYQMKLR